jgi:uncharacterized membrane protein YfcA
VNALGQALAEVLGVSIVATPEIFLLACLAVLLGSVMQGLSGVGLGLVAAPVVILIDPSIGPGPLLVLAMLVSILMLLRRHGPLDRPGLALTLSGRVAGSLAGAGAYALLPLSAFGLVFGLLILLGVLLTALGFSVERTRGNLVSAGFISGVMGTLTSAGSPAIALIYHKSDGDTAKSTLAAFFCASSAISILALLLTGRFSLQQALESLVFVPAMVLGFLVSGVIAPWVSARQVRATVLIVAALSATALVARSLLALI